MPCKVTMFFNAIQGTGYAGWSESYFDPSSTLAGAQANWFGVGAATISLSQPLGRLRVACLGSLVNNTYNRITLLAAGRPPIGPQRRAVLPVGGINLVSGVTSAYNPALAATPTDYAEIRLNYRCETNPQVQPSYTRNSWLGGIPDAATGPELTNLAAGPWTNPITTFFGALLQGIMVQSIDHSGANPLLLCTSFTVVGQVYGFSAPHGLLQGQKVIAVGFKASPGQPVPKGVYVVNVLTANTISLQNQVGTATGFGTLGGFRPVSYAYNNITNIVNRGVTKRNAGRPFGSPVGRARTKKVMRV